MNSIRSFRLLIKYLPLVWSLACLPAFAFAQTESETEATGKSETSMELTYTKSNNRSRILTATVKTKVEDNYEAVNGVLLQFYQTEVAPEKLLGSAMTNEHGIATLIVPEEKFDKTSKDFTLIVAVENNDKFEDNQEEIAFSDADFNMTLTAEDSARQVVILLQTKDAEGNMTPVGDVEVHLYVQRMFGLLPLSDAPETTDENGEVMVDFPTGIPGDTAGNLIIVARVEDHESFGNLEFRRKINWGTPLVNDHIERIRELWSSRANAPLYLIFIVNTMLIGIWGVIAYIVYQVFLIRKIGRQKTA